MTSLGHSRDTTWSRQSLPLTDSFLDLYHYRMVGDGRSFLVVPLLTFLIFRLLGTALLVLIILHVALPKSVPKNTVMKKLFGGLATNFWYGIEEDVYLKASALGLALAMMKNYIGAVGLQVAGIHVSSFCRYIG